MLMLMNHPFARPLIALGHTLYVQTVTINSAQPDFDTEISNKPVHGYTLCMCR